jgi:hypothetical protein
MAILKLGWFCFKKDFLEKGRRNGSEYPWGYYHGKHLFVKEFTCEPLACHVWYFSQVLHQKP